MELEINEQSTSAKNDVISPNNQRQTTSPAKDDGITDTFCKQQGPLKAFISKFIVRPQDVDDIAQETFIRAFKAEKTRKIDHPKAYLYRVARNLALKELTKKSNRMTSFIEDSCGLGVLSTEEDVERQVEVLQKLERVKLAIAGLPPQCQKVFIMRKVYGFSHKEISNQLGISVSTIEKHIVSGLKRCRQSVRRQEMPKVGIALNLYSGTNSGKAD